ncbi:hypothetical protein LWC34_33290 [Kibdelosporangium philippinense]|uniref:Secreted protein n=1 Tax=Kibdelosporangium philippinense TaxID=211113 RepID=A0ABS8ZPE9_9PSEU|nr:hypothetical protein [Kibdelosporangium philippinense]MCE7007662.1 hypothetical protein [Kibdelosporangium philippinense]
MPVKRRFIVLGVLSAAMFSPAATAFADQDEDVLSGFDGDAPLVQNVSVLPMQMCGSGVFVSGLTDVPKVDTGNCTNAPNGNPLQQLITNSTLGR